MAVAATLFGGIATLIAPLLTSANNDDKSGQSSPPAASTSAMPSTGLPSAGPSSTPSTTTPQEQQTGYREVYSGRVLKLRTPRSNECWRSFIDFDKGQVGTIRRSSVPEEAELALHRCYEFGLGVTAVSAGTSTTPAPSVEQCLEAARGGGIQTIEGYDLLKEEDPIKRGTVLCFETAEGSVVRAVAEDVKWVHLKELSVEWGVDYTFRATAWQR
ncbi:hypothetical protein ABTX77_42325 [Streptomyces sp. NPDC097704]|uniref:hypothetical protein n=1 Tax=Streptomyces sp. NPDC097704 TaxID=3157101 RepID=UPI00332C35E5